MYKILTNLRIIFALLLLTHCATQEYLHQKSICSDEAYLKFLPQIVNQEIVRTRYIEKYNGRVTCSTVSNTSQTHHHNSLGNAHTNTLNIGV